MSEGQQKRGSVMARAASVALVGLDVELIDVQIQLTPGLPAFQIVGLPDKAVAESRERVRAALHTIGLAFPPKRVTVNLAPADLVKEGSHYDLAIALALLTAMGTIPERFTDGRIVLGELALDGRIARVNGTLCAAIAATEHDLGLICPAECASEAALLAGSIEILAAPSLEAVLNHACHRQQLVPLEECQLERCRSLPDLVDVKGQEAGKRALEIAAAGGHNLLMVGPPGSGKSMLATRLPSILPPLDAAEILEVGMINSISGRLKNGILSDHRPFRSPHHAASMAAMVGGGSHARPGEVSLAHKGVLFLDELPEFQRPVLDALRQPIEEGTVTVARAAIHATYPARFQLVAAMNPCRCGHLGHPELACNKAPRCGQDYQKRVSGPLMDRFDIEIDMPALSPAEMDLPAPVETSETMRARVTAVRQIQADRFERAGNTTLRTNSEADGAILDAIAPLDDTCRTLLLRAAERLHLSARGWNRVRRVARTIADLDGASAIAKPHLAEALALRRRGLARH